MYWIRAFLWDGNMNFTQGVVNQPTNFFSCWFPASCIHTFLAIANSSWEEIFRNGGYYFNCGGIYSDLFFREMLFVQSIVAVTHQGRDSDRKRICLLCHQFVSACYGLVGVAYSILDSLLRAGTITSKSLLSLPSLLFLKYPWAIPT